MTRAVNRSPVDLVERMRGDPKVPRDGITGRWYLEVLGQFTFNTRH